MLLLIIVTIAVVFSKRTVSNNSSSPIERRGTINTYLEQNIIFSAMPINTGIPWGAVLYRAPSSETLLEIQLDFEWQPAATPEESCTFPDNYVGMCSAVLYVLPFMMSDRAIKNPINYFDALSSYMSPANFAVTSQPVYAPDVWKVVKYAKTWIYRLNNYIHGDGPHNMHYSSLIDPEFNSFFMNKGDEVRLQIFCQEMQLVGRQQEVHNSLVWSIGGNFNFITRYP